ncbi:hypothetical protein [Sphingomonas sp.]|uniref:hypothetical protein n=1 Tax=Sphingomonas sp. TaxID=28214 RepID=UPI0025D8C747|nr:hypothetical protein [Sphingomonas sp.]
MVLFLTAITSLGLISLAMFVIASTLYGSGTAVLSALAAESTFAMVQSKPHVRRAVRLRESMRFKEQPLRVAA